MKTTSYIHKAILFTLMTLAAVYVPAAESPKRALVVTTTAGFRHSCIPTAEKILAEMGKESGVFTVDYARVDPGDAEFNGADGRPDREKLNARMKAVLAEKTSAAALKNYDVVMFVNTTGNLPMPDPQALLDWVNEGHAFVGIHAATDTFANFKPYTEMLGGHFRNHGPQVEVNVLNQDPTCPSCKHLGSTWTVYDEIYQMKDFDGSKVQRLLSLSELMLNPNDIRAKKGTPGDYPVSWSKEYGKGRVFYTSLGHREDLWDPTWQETARKNSPEVAKQYQQHVLGGIRWALHLEERAPKAK